MRRMLLKYDPAFVCSISEARLSQPSQTTTYLHRQLRHSNTKLQRHHLHTVLSVAETASKLRLIPARQKRPRLHWYLEQPHLR